MVTAAASVDLKARSAGARMTGLSLFGKGQEGVVAGARVGLAVRVVVERGMRERYGRRRGRRGTATSSSCGIVGGGCERSGGVARVPETSGARDSTEALRGRAGAIAEGRLKIVALGVEGSTGGLDGGSSSSVASESVGCTWSDDGYWRGARPGRR
jgi:hypothetical protein